MGLNKAFDRSFFLIGGNVKTSGGSLHLAKGQLAAVDLSKTSPDGAKVISTFVGSPKNKKNFVLRCGIEGKKVTRSTSNKDESTMPFAINEVLAMRVSAPKITEQIVDEVIIGYNGIDADSSFNFQNGDSYFRLSLELSGDILAYRGGGASDMEMININVEIPTCDVFNDCEECDNCSTVDCKAVVQEAIERLRRKQLTGGATVDQYVDITPIYECDNAVTAELIPYTYWTLSICDTGSDNAKALVEAEYGVPVIRTNRVGSISTYQLLLPLKDGETPKAYVTTINSFIKDCVDCPVGYTASPAGVLYAITLEDDGKDQTALIEGLPGYVASTVSKNGNDYGVGSYSVVLGEALTDADITTFLGTNDISSTATLNLVGDIAAICEPDSPTAVSTEWVEGDTCNAVVETYSINLPDDVCGNNRLKEVQGAYSDLTIALKPSGNSTIALTLTETGNDDGDTANINVNGVDYLATFATNETTTAANFVTTHAAALLVAGVTVTAALGVLTFTATTAIVDAITITSVIGDLDGTLAPSASIPVTGGCQSAYQTTVISNLVCEECDPIFLDFYVTEAPAPFDGHAWTKDANATTSVSGNCKCGIRFKAKTFVIDGDEALRDIVGFTEASTLIRVSAGYPEEVREGIGRIPEGAYEGVHITRWQPRTHLAGNLRNMENENRFYFRDLNYSDNYLNRVLRGTTSNLEDNIVQYVQYTVTVAHSKNAQSFANRVNDEINYNIFVEVGRHADVENLLNDLAGVAGIEGVQAFGA